ncbi:MAG TPA: glycoside hydrolase family 2 TIM barrel-domain containing protein [Candidatus Tectomicrobia bacterium]|nr:glycoside hydrolase family 2 TIM barrel-domain containing protein [Candidatus Tectomicrobia bacterium]
MGPTRQRALLMALLLGLVLLGHLGGCSLVPHQIPVASSFRASAGPLIAVPPVTLPLSGPWQFAADPAAVGHIRGWGQPDFDDTGWQSVTVPHTWNVMPEYADYAGIAWYRRRLTLPRIAGEAHVRLRFGAIFYLAQVWWNGVYLGEHEGGYTPFEVDVSGLARPGAANVLAVRVDNQRARDRLPAALPTHWSYDWWHYGGIVRDVALHLSSRGFIAHQQLVAVPELVGVGRADAATLTAILMVTNASAQALQGRLTGDVRSENGGTSVLVASPTAPVSLPPGTSQEITLTATLAEPTLWHFDQPHLYRWMATLLAVDGSILHTTDETFGVRAIELREARLYLNGEPVRLVGLTRHADSPAHGLAEPITVMAADFADLKRLNAVLSRPAHYPQADFILDYADRHGLLLIPEIPAWQLSAAQLSHPRIRALAQQQLREMIRSQANHPAVWAWSLGNEFASDTAAGHAFVRELMAVAKSLDPTRPVGFVSNRLGDRPWADATALTDIVLMNAYYGTWSGPQARLGPALNAIHAAWPDKVVIISEYGFAPRWEWIHRRAGADPSEYYTIPPEWARDSEAADCTRQRLIRNQLPVFRSRPFIAGAIFFTYQDHRTPNELMMGVVDAWRQRRGAWAVLREGYAPAVLDTVRLFPASDGTQRATVVMHARGPVERDLPAYTLRGYRLAWTVAASDGQRVFAQGIIALPTIPPGTAWSGTVEWPAPKADYRLTLRLLRPTGFTVFEHTYDAHGRRW